MTTTAVQTSKVALHVPFLDLKQEYQLLKAEGLEEEIIRVLSNAHYVEGPSVAAFEESYARFCGTTQAIAVDNGTAALHLAMLALGIGPGDEVVLPAHTFIATAAAVAMAGAKPVFVDADEKHWQMNLDQVEAAISSRCRAVIAVHLFGQPLDMERLKDICARKKVFLIEDAAQAHGATYRGARTGSFGEVACFSFYPSKNLGAFGDGGAITTSNSELATKLRQLRNHGRVNKYEHGFVGYNYRMDEIQGLVLNTKLPHLDRWNEARRRVAAQYRERLADLPLFIPAEMAHTDAVYHLFTVGTPKRQELAAFLAARKIDTGVHYPVPLHIQPAFAHLGHQESDFPVAADIGREELSLPMFPFMTENQVDWVCASVQEFWKR